MSTITKYKDRHQNWVYRVDTRLESGERKRETFSHKAEAEMHVKALLRHKRLVKLGVSPSSKKECVLVEVAIQKYYSEVTKGKFAKTALKNEGTVFKKFYNFLANDAGCEALDHVSGEIIHNFRETILATGVENSTVNRQMHIVSHFFSKCVEWEYIEKNPCSRLKPLREIVEPPRLWSDADKGLLLSAGSEEVLDVYLFLAEQGARPAETEKLKRRKVDLVNRQVELHCYKNKGSGHRIMPLTERAFRMLERVCEGKGPDDYVFTRDGGKRIMSDFVQKRFFYDRLRLGLNDSLSLYSLRHTFATKLNSKGVPTATVQKLLGHSQIRTTLRYANAGVDDMRKAINTL